MRPGRSNERRDIDYAEQGTAKWHGVIDPALEGLKHVVIIANPALLQCGGRCERGRREEEEGKIKSVGEHHNV